MASDASANYQESSFRLRVAGDALLRIHIAFETGATPTHQHLPALDEIAIQRGRHDVLHGLVSVGCGQTEPKMPVLVQPQRETSSLIPRRSALRRNPLRISYRRDGRHLW